jgi:hypothetical protein
MVNALAKTTGDLTTWFWPWRGEVGGESYQISLVLLRQRIVPSETALFGHKNVSSFFRNSKVTENL